MNIFNEISLRIIKEQALIIGPVAWAEADKVAGVNVIDRKTGEISIGGDGKEVVNKLVTQYEKLFGRASNEVCKEAAHDLLAELPADQVPMKLK